MPFEPASRVTEADKTLDRKTSNRKLQESLYLIVKRNRASAAAGESTFEWQFPQGKVADAENLRQVPFRVG